MSPTQERVTPISPAEVTALQRELIPPEVIEIFNRFIGETVLNGMAVIDQDDLVKELVSRGLTRSDIFKKGWLNIEGIYEEAGWDVEYDKPAYNETGRSTFTFSQRNRRRDGSY